MSVGSARSLKRVFWDGTVVNVLNPKTALFFLAFVPQFIDPMGVNLAAELVALGILFIALGVVTDGAYALAAGAIGGWLGTRPHLARNRRIFSGLVYIGLGITASLGDR